MQEAVQKVVVQRVPPITAKFFNPAPAKVDPADVVLLAQELRTCLRCGGELRVSNDDVREWVCINPECGRVWGSEPDDGHIPFSDSDVESAHSEGGTKPETHLDFGGGLGSHVDNLAFSNILRGRKDRTVETFLTSRTRIARVPLCHPLIRDLLSFGSEFCKKHDLRQRNNGNHARFADQLGINLRLVGEHYVRGISKLWSDKWLVAASIFTLLFKESYSEKFANLRGQKDAKERYPELCLDNITLEYFEKLLQSCNPPVLPTRI